MKKIITLLYLFIIISLSAFAQVSISKEIIGTWKVKTIKKDLLKTKDISSKQLATLEKTLLTSIFIFKADQHFTFNISAPELVMKNERWKYVEKTQTISIYEWKDFETKGELLMEIFISKKNDKYLFTIDDIPLILEVEKTP